MYGQPLSDDVCELLDTCIDSVEALDALLLLLRDPHRTWVLAAIAPAIEASVDVARGALDDLCRRGLAARTLEVGREGARYGAASLEPGSRAAFSALAQVCETQRAAVVEHISCRQLIRMRVLAQAFTRGSRA